MKSASKSIPFALSAFCLCVVTSASAAPSLTKLDYTASEITLTGTNFGPAPKVVLFDNFEHGSKFADLLQSQGNKNNWFSGALPYRESDGNIAHRAKDPAQVALGKKGLAQVIANFPDFYKTALVSFSVKVPKGTTFAGATELKTFPSMSAWKFSWLMSGPNGFQEANSFDVCLPTYPGAGNSMLSCNDGTITYLDPIANWWEWDDYNHVTSYIKIADVNPNTTPIAYSFESFNNFRHYYKEGDNSKYMASAFQLTDFRFDRINIPGWWGNGDNSKFDGLYDNMYVAVGANALARLIVSDSPIYSTSTFAIPLMTKTWANGKIVLDVDVLPKRPGLYVHLIDSSGTVSQNSLPLSCIQCPKPPTPI